MCIIIVLFVKAKVKRVHDRDRLCENDSNQSCTQGSANEELQQASTYLLPRIDACVFSAACGLHITHHPRFT